MRSFLAKYQPTSALSDEELFHMKRDAWNVTNISERMLILNNDQIAKLSNREFECVVNIGNRLYAKVNNDRL